MLEIKDLHIGYEKKKVAGPINERLRPGELVCLLGPNGTGKSTLVKTISGLLSPLQGSIEFDHQSIFRLPNTEKSKILSVVLTDPIVIGNLTVHEIVEFGRYPYKSWWGKNTVEDDEVVQRAISNTGIQHLSERNIGELSDGEKQKVMISRALAQDTDFIILDEPTSHLDLPSKIEIMSLLKELVQKWNKSILVSTHDLSLAIQTADRFWLIDKQGSFFSGINEELILNGQLNTCFNLKDSTYSFSTGKLKLPEIHQKTIQIEGTGNSLKWTKHAIERIGFSIKKEGEISVVVENDERWSIRYGPDHLVVSNFEELISTLISIERS